VENEAEKYYVYFSYQEGIKAAIKKIEDMLGKELHIYDVFPNFDDGKRLLTSPLSIITKSQQEMFLPVGLEIDLIACATILFGFKDEDG
jgi:hypothetical protein